jgi:hypothetical protein
MPACVHDGLRVTGGIIELYIALGLSPEEVCWRGRAGLSWAGQSCGSRNVCGLRMAGWREHICSGIRAVRMYAQPRTDAGAAGCAGVLRGCRSRGRCSSSSAAQPCHPDGPSASTSRGTGRSGRLSKGRAWVLRECCGSITVCANHAACDSARACACEKEGYRARHVPHSVAAHAVAASVE